jgi:hypothetical protein
MKGLLVLGAAVVGGAMAARRLMPSDEGTADGRSGTTMARGLLARMLDRLPPDSPPRLVTSILPRLREQNDEIIALLREQNELLRRAR